MTPIINEQSTVTTQMYEQRFVLRSFINLHDNRYDVIFRMDIDRLKWPLLSNLQIFSRANR